MAEEEGFEPPIPFQVRQFSRLEPSTTRPLFRFTALRSNSTIINQPHREPLAARARHAGPVALRL